MTARSSIFNTPFLLMVAMMGWVSSAMAVKPLIATQVKMDSTLAADSDDSGNFTSYRFTWKDNAFDEAGYAIGGRLSTSSELTVLQTFPANSESGVVTLLTQPKDTVMLFVVMSYKLNGANAEYSYGDAITVTSPGPATGKMDAPTAFTGTLVDDGTIKLKWTDNSTNEMYYQLLYKKKEDTGFSNLGFLYFNTNEIPLQLGLAPGSVYDFSVRATRQAPSDGNTFTDTKHVTASAPMVELTIPALAAPTELTATASGETSVQLSWKDNSKNETGYQVEYKTGDATDFTVLGTVGANSTSLSVPTPPATTTQWQVRAIYKTTTVTTAIQSGPSNTATVNTLFPAPTELVAVTSAHAGSVELTWKDNSTSESYFDIYTRKAGTSDAFGLALTVPAGTTKALVNSRTATGASTATPLELNTLHEFKVQGRYPASSGAVVSGDSNVATAQARPGITSRFYQPATVNASFYYAITASSDRTSWNVTGLPTGLVFSTSTGVVSGAPTVPGVFQCPMTVTFGNGYVAEATLTLRVLRVPKPPTVVGNLPSFTIAPKASVTIPLADKFSDPDSEQAVRLTTNMDSNGDGQADTIDILLYPSLAPQGVANFLGYVNAGSYDGVSFHRSIPGFVIQGGGYTPVSAPKTFQSVAERASPVNEPGISNVRGTLSAAKLGNNPNSATHDFFVNLADNNDATNPDSLDNQNGGFTVFGRVAGSGMTVVDAIAGLPTGDYVDKNDYTVATPQYNAALDKRVIVDGSAASFQDFPMKVSGSAPADMDVNSTVRILAARQINPLTYKVVSNTAPDVASATISGSDVIVQGLKAGTASIMVSITDLDGNSAPQPAFTVSVVQNYKGPVITRQPVSAAVALGGKATFTVGATGTSLHYQWRRNGVNVSGANSASLTVSNVSDTNTGAYDVVVGNQTTNLVSSAARLDLKSISDITANPVSRLIKVGDPLKLTLTVIGAPTPTIAWTRDGKAVAGQKLPELSIAAAKLTDAGSYKAVASNALGKDTSGIANVCIVDPATVVTTVKAGTKTVLKAGLAGPFTSYQWVKDGTDLPDDDLVTKRVVGSKTATLTISAAAEATDTGSYTCRAVAPDGLGTTTTGAQKLIVVSHVPILAAYTAATGVVGFDYDFTVPYDKSSITNTPNSFFLASLPLGLTYDTKTGRITGRPRVAGTYSVTTYMRNVIGISNVVVGTMQILPMAQGGVGTFLAAIEPSGINGNKGGRLDLTILDQGTYTGRITLASDTYSFAGVLTYYPGVYAPQSQIVVQRKGKTPILLSFSMDSSTGQVSGQVTDGSSQSNIIGFRQFWDAKWNPSNFFAGSYVMAFNIAPGDLGKPAVPQGSGYATMTVSKGGGTYLTGKLSDGTGITASSLVGPFGQFLVYQMLYKNTGSVLGLLGLGTSNLGTTEKILRVDGNLGWIKDPQTVATERTYKAGIGQISLNVVGRTAQPATMATIMNVPLLTNNVQLDFSQGGVENSVVNPDVVFTMPAVNLPKFVATSNPGKVTLNVGANATFSGTFTLADPSALKRAVTYQGMLIPKIPAIPAVAATSTTAAVAEVPAVDATGVGYFLLPQLPSTTPPVTTLTTSPILSGKVELKPIGITATISATIVPAPATPTPATPTLNPGEQVTFAVVASGQGSLTYQWMKDGVAISGATATSYLLTAVTEAAQGTYTVVVTNGSVSVTSNALPLSVNDPLTSVTVTRSPGSASVSPGVAVTFTANPVGTGPYTYQWIKDGTIIVDATAATYAIAAAAATDVGDYSVKVTTPLTPAGITSAVNHLAVGDAVTNVVASRTPSDETVGTGANVTFSVTAVGTAPLTYQWKKGGTDISGATGSTYNLPSATMDDAGSYTVLVSNTTTPAGVLSNAVPLLVTDAVANVVATRSPSSTVVGDGTQVTFSVTAQGASPLEYQWRKGGAIISGATSSTLVITATASDIGDYDVVVSNPTTTGGLASNIVNLDVGTPLSNVVASRNPNSSDVNAGINVVFSVTANGTGPFSYQWRKDDVDIEGAIFSSYTIVSTAPGDTGAYDVKVSSPVNSGPDAVGSNKVALHVLDTVRNVTANRTPVDSLVVSGTTVSFEASAEGANLTYQWRKNGVDIPGDAAKTSVLTFGATPADNGVYDVVVFNPLTPGGVPSNGVDLTVVVPVGNVVASVSPSNNVTEGSPAVFSVTSIGTGPLTYQWRKGNMDIVGATGSSYTIPSCSSSDAGDYDVVVSNPYSSGPNAVTSNSVSLSVSPR